MSQNDEEKPFLGVASSCSGQKWVDRLDRHGRNQAAAISQENNLSDLIGRVLAGRDVKLQEAQAFLKPTIRDLMPNPDVLTGMPEATDRIIHAIKSKQKIAIFGDYDVDGACSSALLEKFLSHHSIHADIYIPDRIFEGYGPNPTAIRSLIEDGAQLIITVDCGATSFEALSTAAELGVDVVVLDHHQMGHDLPPCKALVNPNRQDDLSGLGYLCAAGVVFMTLVSVSRGLAAEGIYTQTTERPDLLSWLDLVALATICDVVPLKGLNRAFVVTGLQVMTKRQNRGLKALMKTGRLDGPPKAYHLGFLLGPRINAGGRIGDAALGARLLTTSDDLEAAEIATQLEELNKARQQAEKRMLEEAIAEADAEFSKDSPPSVIVTESEQWHPGIVGLLASRLKDRFNRPAFSIAFDSNGRGSGSGRSLHGIDLGAAVRAALQAQILEKGGGHAMAAGITISKDQLGPFRAFMEAQLQESVERVSSLRELKVDGALTARSATLELYDLVESAGPYGQGHPQPVFAFPAHQLRYVKVVGDNHVSFTASAGDGAQLRGIAFRSADTEIGKALLNAGGNPVHLAGTLNADFWQGSRRIQLRLLDIAN